MLQKLVIAVVLINLGEYYCSLVIQVMNEINVKPISIAVSSDRTKDKIYENIHGNMCFRRLNATHQTGCSCKN